MSFCNQQKYLILAILLNKITSVVYRIVKKGMGIYLQL